ncbi:hypothetical protein HYDPIDRAFT_116815 [Hydnomerulius pinastri MD-312]|uniref:F-box domain-containing protein n=1 Tax=Hydnomerulius pinastri MD-312 TaxID=994086 RepID=A0A0C9VSC0_9AGAM|nr:hypothetical protein HYDPIDRAFT_116815 [Hydnomerulius pinastri MD-312]
MFYLLPNELIAKVFDHFDVPSLLQCDQVCKLFHALISESTHLLYKIELFASCMEDAGNRTGCELQERDRLQVLWSYNQAWQEMLWSNAEEVPLERGGSLQLSGGVLAQVVGRTEGRVVSFVQLPCRIKGIFEKRWTVKVEFHIREFNFDVSQDLLVCLEVVGHIPSDQTCNIHLRSFSTGKVHPLPSSTLITHSPHRLNSWRDPEFIIQICGCYVGILFIDGRDGGASGPSDLVVWNWQTGDRELVDGFSFPFLTLQKYS